MNKILSETAVLKDVTEKLDLANIPYMLTGSFALGYYVQPRMTRDIDLVVLIKMEDVNNLMTLFSKDYYVSKDAVMDAISKTSMFNIIHNNGVMKLDFIVRKKDEYRLVEFERRKKVLFADFELFIVSKEDLILSKMIWSKDTNSEMQYRDIISLLLTDLDETYLNYWVKKLNLEEAWNRIKEYERHQ